MKADSCTRTYFSSGCYRVKPFCSFIVSLYFIIVGTLAAGVYPSHAAGILKNNQDIVFTPDAMPLVFPVMQDLADLFESQLTPEAMLELTACNATAGCDQRAVNAGATAFLSYNGMYGSIIAYYDDAGNLVGTLDENGVYSGLPEPTGGVSDPATLNTTVGTVAGGFTVTPGGAASYSIPIDVPPGTNGVQPEVSLVYDSQASNGVVGVGWSIGGISQITRCPSNRAIDGYTGSVNHDLNDKFCLDGQRLILVSGTYGVANSTYRTEIDSQQIVTAKGSAGAGPAYFKVETPGGTKMIYGFSEGIYDSRLEANVNGTQTSSTVSIWALGKVEDIHGNYYKLAYQQDKDITLPYVPFGIHYEQGNSVTQIDYTGNDTQGVAPYASVEFIYEDRSGYDVTHFRGGSGEVIGDRLKTIRTTVDGATVKEYRLTYSVESTTNQDRVATIQECSPTSCKPATSYNWQDGTNSLSDKTWTGRKTAWQGADYYNLTGDFNGDGKTDIFSPHWPNVNEARVRISNGNGFSNEIWDTTGGLPFSYTSHVDANALWSGDFNGDGLTDLAGYYYNNGYKLMVHLSTGADFNSSEWVTMSIQPALDYVWTGDFNGDGRTDIATISGASMYVYLSEGNRFQEVVWNSHYPTLTVDGYNYSGDYNGDGLTDIAWGSGQVLISTGSNFVLENFTSDWGPLLTTTYTGDFNGDGLTDIATVFNQTTEVTIRMSTGKSFLKYTWNSTFAWNYKIFVHDFNGDGLSDIAGVYGGALNVHLSTGSGFAYSQWPVDNNWEPGDYAIYTGAGDFNGDGLGDIYTYNGAVAASVDSNIYIKLSTGNVPNLMTGATDGYGNTTSVIYKPLTDNTVYTKDSPLRSYPTLSVQSAMQVVSKKFTPDGMGGTTRTDYTYEKYRVDLGGRGPLGFRRTISNNTKTGLVTKVDYRMSFPYTGMIDKERQELNGVLLSINDKTADQKTVARAGGTTTTPYVKTDVVESYDPLNAGAYLKTVTTTSTIDRYTGNVVTTNVSTTDGIETYTTNTESRYESPGTASCHPYLPTRTETYKQGPLGTTPLAVKEFFYTDKCQLDYEDGHVDDAGAISAGLHKSYGYDGFGHTTSTTIVAADATYPTRGISTEYDNRGRFPVEITNEHGHVTTMQSDSRFGGVTSSTDANGLTSTTQYDEFGRVRETLAADGTRVVTEYDWCTAGCIVLSLKSGVPDHEALTTVTKKYFGGTGSMEQLAPDAVVYYDTLGRDIRTETSDASGRRIHVDTNYDDLGRVVASTQPYFSYAPADKNTSTTAYDDLSRPVTVTSPDGGVSRMLYDGFNVSYETDVLDPVTGAYTTQGRTEINNFIGQNIESIDNAGQSIHRVYEVNGNLWKIQSPKLDADGITVLDPKGTVTVFDYDVFGRKTAMSDPDMGSWSYQYNMLSELVSQTDARGQTTSMLYDKMGRMFERTDGDGTVTHFYYNDDLNAGDVPATMAIGKLDSVVMTDSAGSELYRKTIDYNLELGLPYRNTVRIDDNALTSFTTETGYDRFNRPEIASYPETSTGDRLQVKNVYDTAGVLDAVTSIDGATVYWQADERDAPGRVVESTLGKSAQSNGTSSWRTFDKAGRADMISTLAADGSVIYEALYQYDTLGNLRQRDEQRDDFNYVSEQFDYDNLNRLTAVTTDGVPTLSNSYDILGNIRSKSDAGNYFYNNPRPHAVSRVGSDFYLYDENGNLVYMGGSTVTWTAFNKPDSIKKVDPQTGLTTYINTFKYGPDRSRYFRRDFDLGASSVSTTYYAGGYERVSESGVTRHKHYIRGSEGVVATYTVTDDGTTQTAKTEYLHRDYQGSVVAVSDDTGSVIAQLGFDAFGQRRAVTGDTTVDPIIDEVTRGYTGHEHLDDVGLVHMNGRVYHPVLGRFLSADPLVQAPNNLQSYNRYAYVFNNPMSYTDPSGFRSLRGHLRRLGNLHNKAVGGSISVGLRTNTATALYYTKPVKRFMLKHAEARLIGQVAAGVADGFGCAGACSTAYGAYITDISGGSYADIGKGATISALTAMAFAQVHSTFGDMAKTNGEISLTPHLTGTEKVLKVLAHGAIGGVSAYASGGSFSDGFWSAGVSQAAVQLGFYRGTGAGMRNHIVYNTIVASLVGGTVSQATGGSFSQGARAGMYGMVFNELGAYSKLWNTMTSDSVSYTDQVWIDVLRQLSNDLGWMSTGALMTGQMHLYLIGNAASTGIAVLAIFYDAVSTPNSFNGAMAGGVVVDESLSHIQKSATSVMPKHMQLTTMIVFDATKQVGRVFFNEAASNYARDNE